MAKTKKKLRNQLRDLWGPGEIALIHATHNSPIILRMIYALADRVDELEEKIKVLESQSNEFESRTRGKKFIGPGPQYSQQRKSRDYKLPKDFHLY
jgi:hypothetical protein